MKRKTFKKMLMSYFIPRNEAERLSREICETWYSRDNPSALGTCIVAYIMAPVNLRIKACEGYYGYANSAMYLNGNGHICKGVVPYNAVWVCIHDIAESRDAPYYSDDEIVKEINAQKYPDLAMCLARMSDMLNRNYERATGC